jgi:2-polyprenyl-6-methoxyphenol hydroxylase-like FAD-dependent oxidoreductase
MNREYDVAIVGYGPVGQTLAILLGRLGHRVGVFERWPSLYPRPRAVHYDDEIARVFQRLELAEELRPVTEPATTYEWHNARGQTLLRLDRSGPGPSGWPSATMFSQPQLEEILDRAAKAVPSVDVHQGWEVADLADTSADVRLSVREGTAGERGWAASGQERELRARYAIGCDGANSLVRARMGTGVEDLGFAFDWLIADTIPRDPRLLAGVNLQRCDPARPTTLVSGGPGRRRWEWMLLPGETAEQVEDPAFAWRLLADSGVGPADVRLERHAVYRFRARWAERWRVGRLLLAGDAAHLMPPFAGQGMCSGIRDAVTLAWQLDLVLKGRAAEDTLDAYTSERRGHVQSAIAVSVQLGRVICIAEEAEAAARDAAMLAAAEANAGAPPIELPPANLGPGIHEGPPAAGAHASAGGTLFPQGRASAARGGHLLEDAMDLGFVLYAVDVSPATLLDHDRAAFLRELGASLVEIDEELDPDGVYRDWFDAHRCTVALVRPDFYVFGTAAGEQRTHALVDRLRTALMKPARSKETIPA